MSTEQLIKKALRILQEISFDDLDEIQSAITETEYALQEALSELEDEGWNYKDEMDRCGY